MKKEQARNKWLICVPSRDIMKLLHKYHEGDLHPGINRMQKMLGNLMILRGMMNNIRKYVQSCHVCQVSKPKSCIFSAPWQAVLPEDRGKLVAVDMFGPIVKGVYGYTGILVILDTFSKFVKLYGMRRATSNECLGKVESYVRMYGTPERILSDNGPQFRGQIWSKGLRKLGVREVHTAIRNPRGNPCERYIKLVAECLRIDCGGKHNSWVKSLGKIENFINYQYSGVTGELPIELQVKGKCWLEVEKYIKYPKSSAAVNWKDVEQQVRERLKMQAKRRNQYCVSRMKEFLVGQKVLIKKNGCRWLVRKYPLS